jgi:hypothetical protein
MQPYPETGQEEFNVQNGAARRQSDTSALTKGKTLMQLFNLRVGRILAFGAGCLCSSPCVFPAPSIVGNDLLAMVPAGAEICSELRSGEPVSFLVRTRSNIVDLTDFQSLTGADVSRAIGRVVLIATSTPSRPLAEHALLANGHYDSQNIFKAALSNGAAETEYLGFRVLVIQPMKRNRDVAPDVRWLIIIDGKTAVFGTVAVVREALRRYLDQTPPDALLRWNLAHLRADDQSWSIVAASVRGFAMVRRSLVPLDASLGDPIHAGEGLVLGIHFGRMVELEYENMPDWQQVSRVATDPAEWTEPTQRPGSVAVPSFSLRNVDNRDHHTLKVSRQQYEKWIARQTVLPGEPSPHADQFLGPSNHH